MTGYAVYAVSDQSLYSSMDVEMRPVSIRILSEGGLAIRSKSRQVVEGEGGRRHSPFARPPSTAPGLDLDHIARTLLHHLFALIFRLFLSRYNEGCRNRTGPPRNDRRVLPTVIPLREFPRIPRSLSGIGFDSGAMSAWVTAESKKIEIGSRWGSGIEIRVSDAPPARCPLSPPCMGV